MDRGGLGVLAQLTAAITYLGALVLEDAAFNWIKPMPRPPKAPASNPRRISSGTFSKIGDLFCLAIDRLPHHRLTLA